MKQFKACRAGMVLVSLMLFTPIAQAVVLNQVDNFQDGTEQGWNPGASNIATGGPAGGGDRFMQISSGSFGSFQNLAVKNSDARWIGNYTAAGVTQVEVDFRNLQSTPLEMRVVLFIGPNDRATSTAAFNLPADNAWHHAIFSVQAGDLTVVNGFSSVAAILANVTTIMFRHDSDGPSLGGTPVSSQLGLDNIIAVPEPASCALLAAGLLICIRRRSEQLRG